MKILTVQELANAAKDRWKRQYFCSVEQAKQWCIDNRDRPFSYILDSAYDKETKKKVY